MVLRSLSLLQKNLFFKKNVYSITLLVSLPSCFLSHAPIRLFIYLKFVLLPQLGMKNISLSLQPPGSWKNNTVVLNLKNRVLHLPFYFQISFIFLKKWWITNQLSNDALARCFYLKSKTYIMYLTVAIKISWHRHLSISIDIGIEIGNDIVKILLLSDFFLKSWPQNYILL